MQDESVRCRAAPAFTGHKYEYVAQQLGYLTGTDLYDAYIEGRLTTAALRKLFLTHIEQPAVAHVAYVQLEPACAPAEKYSPFRPRASSSWVPPVDHCPLCA